MEQFVEYLKWVSFLLFQSWLWAPLQAGLGSGGHGQGWAGSQCLGEVGSSWDCRASIEEETTLMWLESHWKCSEPMSCPVGGARTHCVAVFASGCLRSEKFHWLSPRALTWAPCWVGYIKAPLFSLELCHSLNHSSFPFAMHAFTHPTAFFCSCMFASETLRSKVEQKPGAQQLCLCNECILCCVSLVDFCAGADASRRAWSWAGSGAPAGLCVCFCCNSGVRLWENIWTSNPYLTRIEIYM